jgi:hypothetical protein
MNNKIPRVSVGQKLFIDWDGPCVAIVCRIQNHMDGESVYVLRRLGHLTSIIVDESTLLESAVPCHSYSFPADKYDDIDAAMPDRNVILHRSIDKNGVVTLVTSEPCDWLE